MTAPLHLINVHLDIRINRRERLAQLAPPLDASTSLDSTSLEMSLKSPG
jgi:hypothetical protein